MRGIWWCTIKGSESILSTGYWQPLCMEDAEELKGSQKKKNLKNEGVIKIILIEVGSRPEIRNEQLSW